MQAKQRAKGALKAAGYAGSVEDALHPGRARQDAIRWAIARLLGGGKDVDDVARLLSRSGGGGSALQDQLLSEEERDAQRCQQLLSLLGVKTSIDDIRGCGPEGGGAQLLLHLAELVAAVASQADCGSSGAAGGSACAATHLLDAAVEIGPRLWGEALQLFPRDMAPLMEEYRDAAQDMPSVLATLRTRLAALPSAAMPSADEAADAATAAWSQGMAAATESLEDLADAEAQLAGVFEQELSIWAEGADLASGSEPSRVGAASSSGCVGLGAAASKALAGYEGVGGLIEALGTLMDMHATLQDVPCDWLAELSSAQSAAAAQLEEATAALAADGVPDMARKVVHP
ncbi:hypothetical protein Rsub_11446 [Raphidocelis subcapitata]|uniref:Uncharacterized protein n=1 Tax=Raphidocelis subcapitata TaxID=307507 RepID=A0A2V0PI52_9CHLO|nr:hypothetical protein Rsub_11446 [Raphidocelis subcapitata]|eukprot:GBF99239.1 hypothetical protein Rsub_11446 [Raphidocelis subcapitata]